MYKVAVMQPYIFPYIGYWQLIRAVDEFVLLDDVNYIVRGYINRNTILLNGQPYRFTIPIKKASQNRLIMHTKLDFTQKEKDRFLLTIYTAYHKAKSYDLVMPLIEAIINNSQDDLTEFIRYSINIIDDYLHINTKISISSEVDKDLGVKAQDRIIEICKRKKADIYINPCGGRKLYEKEMFARENIKLLFLDPDLDSINYFQNQDTFQKSLSIIDILMFNTKDKITEFLGRYKLSEN